MNKSNERRLAEIYFSARTNGRTVKICSSTRTNGRAAGISFFSDLDCKRKQGPSNEDWKQGPSNEEAGAEHMKRQRAAGEAGQERKREEILSS